MKIFPTFFLCLVAITSDVAAFSNVAFYSSRLRRSSLLHINDDASFRRRTTISSISHLSMKEGDAHMDQEAMLIEIMEMGGDPSFLMDVKNDDYIPESTTDDNQVKDEVFSARAREIEAMGGDPFFMTDEDIEEATTRDEDESDQQIASDIMTKLTMAGGGAASILDNYVNEENHSNNDEEHDSQMNEDTLTSQAKQIEAMGGDPFFMVDEGESDSTIADDDENDQQIASDILAKLSMAGGEATGANILNSIVGGQEKDGDDGPIIDDGEDFEARLMEIEAMGGDPFFMMEDDGGDESDQTIDEDEEDSQIASDIMAKIALAGGGMPSILNTVDEQRYATDGLGPSPKFKEPELKKDPDWEWDGQINEDAHLDFD